MWIKKLYFNLNSVSCDKEIKILNLQFNGTNFH